MKLPHLLIRLECQGQRLCESTVRALPPELIIGRAEECAWRVPAGQSMVSARHCGLYRRGAQVQVRDAGSRNGLFLGEARIHERDLQPGDRITFGDCALVVEAIPRFRRPRPPALIGRTASLAGKRVAIWGASLRIGSDDALELRITNPVISKRHAEVYRQDERWWLKDLGSTNGTTLNGRRLRPSEPAALAKGDRVFVGHFAFTFDDGVGLSPEALFRWGTAGAGGMAVLVLLGLRVLLPGADQIVDRARASAAQGDFDGARAGLARAVGARKARFHLEEIAALSSNVAAWEAASRGWGEAEGSLGRGDWAGAARALDQLPAESAAAWEWSREGRDAGQEAGRVRPLVAACVAVDAMRRRPPPALPQLAAEHARVRQALAAPCPETSGYWTSLLPAARQAEADLASWLDMMRPFNDMLNGLTNWPPDLTGTLATLDEKRRDSRPDVSRQASALYPAVEELTAALAAHDTAVVLLRDMRLDELAAIQVDFAPEAAGADDPRLVEARASILRRFATMQKAGRLLARVREQAADEAQLAAQARLWQDRDAWASVLTCDALRQPPPAPDRREGAGQYDRYLGNEDVYRCLFELSGRLQVSPLPSTPFRTARAAYRDLATAIEALLAFVSAYRDEPWAGGAVAKRVTALEDCVQRRDALVQELLEAMADPSARKGLIAGCTVLQLAPDPGQLKVKGEPLPARLTALVKANFVRMDGLEADYEAAVRAGEVERRDEVARVVLAEGLPGAPFVNRLWAERFRRD